MDLVLLSLRAHCLWGFPRGRASCPQSAPYRPCRLAPIRLRFTLFPCPALIAERLNAGYEEGYRVQVGLWKNMKWFNTEHRCRGLTRLLRVWTKHTADGQGLFVEQVIPASPSVERLTRTAKETYLTEHLTYVHTHASLPPEGPRADKSSP